MSIYFDYNATAPLRPEARAAMLDALGPPANASSVHGFGQSARHKIETARRQLAALCRAMPEEVIFTSGGTEANAMALVRPAPQIITSMIEHVAVLDNSPDAIRIGVDGNGVIDLAALEDAVKAAPEGSIVSVMAANNETGVIQPLPAVIKLAHDHGHLVHCDAVQALGKIDLHFADLKLDMMAVSGHKIGAATGVGALIQREGLSSHPRMNGGGQEKNRRPGTENLSGITGFGAAAEAADQSYPTQSRPTQLNPTHLTWGELRQHHDDFEARIYAEAPDAVVLGREVDRLPNTTAIAMPGRAAETQIMSFDLDGIALSAGAACSSGKVASSHVLTAMGAGDIAPFTVRISSGWDTKPEDFDRLAETWLKFYKQA